MDNDQLKWSELIGFMYQVRAELSAVKPDIYPLTPPYVGATEEKLAAAEYRLGFELDPQHRDFLRCGDGWAEFFRDIYLLGTGDFGAGQAMAVGRRLLDICFEEADGAAQLPEKNDLLPIAIGTEDIDLFALWRTGPVTAGGRPVLWFAGEEIDRFVNFRECFLSVHEHLSESLAEGGA